MIGVGAGAGVIRPGGILEKPLPLDVVSGAYMAFANRQLRAAHTSDVCTIRESDGSTEEGIGLVGRLLDEAELLTHVGANSGLGAAFLDQSGNTRNITQSTADQQPTLVSSGTIQRFDNNQPGFNFDNSNDLLLSGTSSTLWASGWTFCCRINAGSLGGGSQGRMIENRRTRVWLTTGTGGAKIRLDQDFSVSNAAWVTVDTVITFDQDHHVAVTYNHSADTNVPIVYVDGVAVTLTEPTPSGTATTTGLTTLAFGNRHAGDRSFDGLLGDILLYNSILSASQIAVLAAL